MSRQPGIGIAEMEILDFVQQQQQPVTVRQVAEHFAATRGHVRTTVLNVMVRLWRKGFLARRQHGGVHRYSPRVTRGQVLRRLVGDFVEKVLQGNVSPFVAYLAEEAELTEQDRQELQAIVRDLDQRRRGKP
jgi:predicted transcriptional regulator